MLPMLLNASTKVLHGPGGLVVPSREKKNRKQEEGNDNSEYEVGLLLLLTAQREDERQAVIRQGM